MAEIKICYKETTQSGRGERELKIVSKTRDAGILGSNSELLVFAPAYPTRKGTVLGQLWFLPTSKTMLLVLSCS